MADGFLAFAPDLAQAGGGYDPEHFSRMFHLESGNFWFRARNRLIQWALGRHFPEAHSFCEVGCGTGFVLSGIRSAYPHLELSGNEVVFNAIDLNTAANRIERGEHWPKDKGTL